MPDIDHAKDIRRAKSALARIRKEQAYFTGIRLSEAALRCGEQIKDLERRIAHATAALA
jgi:hypothetical protein